MTTSISHLALQAPRWEEIDRMPDQEAATLLDSRARALDAILRTAFIELGAIVSCYEKRQLWKHVQSLETHQCFHSFNDWLLNAAPYSRSHCYAAKGIVEELTKDIPLERLMGVNESNARVLMLVSSGVRLSLVESAKKLSENDLIDEINDEHPEQHIERRQPVVMAPVSVSKIIEQAIEVATALYGCKSRGEAEEAIHADFLQAHQADMEREQSA